MQVYNVVLQNECPDVVSPGELAAVVQALQIQVERDFAPYWGIHANVAAFSGDGPAPAGAWVIHIKPEHSVGVLGIHLTDDHGVPDAAVEAGDGWSVRASHELLEMLADPRGSKFLSAPSKDPNAQGRLVSYLVEVCDPCEIYSYAINGVAVSDFVTREYFMQTPPPGATVDVLGHLTKPLDTPPGCFISWRDETGGDKSWYQITADTGNVIQGGPSKSVNPRESRDEAFQSAERGKQHDLCQITGAHAANVAEKFHAFVAKSPRFGDATITLFGTVYHAESGEGYFRIVTPDGRATELPQSAVREFKEEPGGAVQIKVVASALSEDQKRGLSPPPTAVSRPGAELWTVNESWTETWAETTKEATGDAMFAPSTNWADQGGAYQANGTGNPAAAVGGQSGVVPFVILIPNHAPLMNGYPSWAGSPQQGAGPVGGGSYPAVLGLPGIL